MVFSNAWILLKRVNWICEAKPKGAPNRYYRTQPETYLHRFNEYGDNAGAELLASIRIVLPDSDSKSSLRPKDAVYRSKLDKPQEVLIRLEDVNLSDCALSMIESNMAFRASLIEKVFFGHEFLFPQHFLSIMYLEPPNLLVPPQSSSEKLIETIKYFRKELGQEKSVAVPQQFKDLFVFPGPFGLNQERNLLAIRTAPLNRHGREEYAIPQSVLTLAEAVALIAELEVCNSSGGLRERFPIRPPNEDLQKLIDESRRNLRVFANKKAYKVYWQQLQERVDFEGALWDARPLKKSYDYVMELFSSNARSLNDDWIWTSDKISGHPWLRYGVVAKLRKRLMDEGEGFDGYFHLLESRNNVIRECSRDIFNAEFTRSNNKLQFAMYCLTIVLTIIASFSLADLLADLFY